MFFILKILRPRQWIKNGFVFTPLIFTGMFTNVQAIGQVFSAALWFCIAASAVYILNDIQDRERDKQHPTKSKSRPLASGAVSLKTAWILLFSLYALLTLAAWLQPKVIAVIVIYIVINIFYSLRLKHEPVLDIFTIAIGFVLRVYAGALALEVPMSSWMFVTTLCLALYLAAVKRRQELNQNGSQSREVLSRYSVALVDRYAEMAACGALIFYSLFVMSTHPELVVTIPLVLFGLFRYWYVVEVLDRGESPTDALLADTPLLSTVALWIGSCMWVLWPTGAHG